MKNALLSLTTLFVFSFTSCTNSPTEKAIALAESFHKEFETKVTSSIKYSNLDSLYSSIDDEEGYKLAIEELDQLQSEWKYQAMDYYADMDNPAISKSLKENMIRTQDQIRNCLKYINSAKAKFTPKFRGYILNQTYIFQTLKGDSVMLRSFLVNNDVTHIVNVESNSIPVSMYEKMIERHKISTKEVLTWNIIKEDSLYLTNLGITENHQKSVLCIDTMEFVR